MVAVSLKAASALMTSVDSAPLGRNEALSFFWTSLSRPA